MRKQSDTLACAILTSFYLILNFNLLNDHYYLKQNAIRFRNIFLLVLIIYFVIKNVLVTGRIINLINMKLKKLNIISILFFLSFSASIFVSEIYKNEIPINSLIYMLVTFFTFQYLIPNNINRPIKVIMIASFISSFVFLVLSTIWVPFNFQEAYLGITGNSNSLGQIATLATLSSFSLFLISKANKSKLFYIFSSIISFWFVLISNSRTSFLAILTSLIVYIIFKFRDLIKVKRFIVSSSFILVIYNKFLRKYITMGIIKKFNTHSNNLFSDRNLIWSKIWNEKSIFGHSTEYIRLNRNIGAHNSLMSILDEYGMIAVTFLGLFILSTLILTVKYYNNHKKDINLIPLIIVISYLVLGLGENMYGAIGKSYSMIYFNLTGIILFKSDTYFNIQ